MDTTAAISILVVDDDELFGRAMLRDLAKDGYQATFASSSEHALRAMEQRRFDVLVSDICMPGDDGISLVAAARDKHACNIAFVMSGQMTQERASQALDMGAAAIFEKPINHKQFLSAIQSHLYSTQSEVGPATDVPTDSLQEALRWRDEYAPGLLGESAAIVRLLQSLMRVSDVESNVLILGESGSGKELVARALHASGPRSKGPFVPLNCAAIPKELAESELFGYSKGAFTGALASRPGRFAVANKGTLFLDEMGEMDLATQAKLLRVVQEREFTPVGEMLAQKTNVRIIAATNRALRERVEQGEFREDLFFRLSVIVLRIPPLRARKSDIPVLVSAIIKRVNTQNQRRVTGVSSAVMQQLMQHDWPGNIRELENTIERLVVTTREGMINLQDLEDADFVLTAHPDKPSFLGAPADVLQGDDNFDLKAEIDRVEAALIDRALRACNGNQKRAADLLKVNRTTLIEKMRRINNRQLS